MYKFLVFVIIVLGPFHTLVAQQPRSTDSLEVYKYWAHRGIIEMVYAYMQDYVEAVGEDKVTESELEGKNKYEKKFISNIHSERLPGFNSISAFLNSNNWKGAETAILQSLVKKMKDTIPLDTYFFLDAKRNIGKNTNESILVPIDYIPSENNNINNRVFWKIKAEEIVQNYQKNLVSISRSNIGIKEVEELHTPPVMQYSNQAKQDYSFSNPNWIKLLIYIALFVFGLFIGGFLVFYISRTKIYSILSLERDKYLYDLRMDNESFVFNYIGLVHILKRNKDEYKGEIEIWNRNYKELVEKEKNTTSQLDKLRSEKQQGPSKINEIKSGEIEDIITKEWDNLQPQQISRTKLFFSMPESDGRFLVNNGDTSNDGRKYYKIEYQESADEGDLYFISGERDRRAINRLESYLKPACDIENIINAELATRIDFISPGKVVLMNDSWVVDSNRKVKIKLT